MTRLLSHIGEGVGRAPSHKFPAAMPKLDADTHVLAVAAQT